MLAAVLVTVACSKGDDTDLIDERIKPNATDFFSNHDGSKWESTYYRDLDVVDDGPDTSIYAYVSLGTLYSTECGSNYVSNIMDSGEITVNELNRLQIESEYYNEYDNYTENVIETIIVKGNSATSRYESYEDGVLAWWSEFDYKRVDKSSCN